MKLPSNREPSLTVAPDWDVVSEELGSDGNAVLPGLLTSEQCQALIAMYPEDMHFRSRVVMARHGFGLGEYKYFSYPLPDLLQNLRTSLYPILAPIANRWNERMGLEVRYPNCLDAFLDRCHAAGQLRPTPLLLEYGPGDFNCLHQDLYGEHVFPLQLTILLARPEIDFSGGEFVMTESGSGRARANVVSLQQGDAVLFAVNQRPVQGARAARRVAMRHGVSRIRSGSRHTIGLIFHDAK
jgi:hypothetical protein